jgi:hypothetical protein
MTYRGGKLMITPIQWTNMDENEIYLITLMRKKHNKMNKLQCIEDLKASHLN